jgi:hypothetical protein
MRERLANVLRIVIGIVVASAVSGCGGSGSANIATEGTTKTAQHTTITPEAAPHYGTGPGTGTGAKDCGGKISGACSDHGGVARE